MNEMKLVDHNSPTKKIELIGVGELLATYIFECLCGREVSMYGYEEKDCECGRKFSTERCLIVDDSGYVEISTINEIKLDSNDDWKNQWK